MLRVIKTTAPHHLDAAINFFKQLDKFNTTSLSDSNEAEILRVIKELSTTELQNNIPNWKIPRDVVVAEVMKRNLKLVDSTRLICSLIRKSLKFESKPYHGIYKIKINAGDLKKQLARFGIK